MKATDKYCKRIWDMAWKIDDTIKKLPDKIIPEIRHFVFRVEQYKRRVSSKNYDITRAYIASRHDEILDLARKIKDAQKEGSFEDKDILAWHRKLYLAIDRRTKVEKRRKELKEGVNRIIIALYELSFYLHKRIV